MAIEYVNRRGDRYYLMVGRTKTGKPKYYCSKKLQGTQAEALPDGFEWHENPENAQVSVRKIRPSRLLSVERELVVDAIRSQAGLEHFIVEVEGDSLVVYLCDRDPEGSSRLIGSLFGLDASGPFSPGLESIKNWTAQHSHYSPMLKFDLQDTDERTFTVERWCFRGSIDGWVPLRGRGPLESLLRNYVQHLGRESFYELM